MSRHSALNTFGRSGNPAFTRNFTNANSASISRTERMTLDGAVNKTAILMGLCFSGAALGWNIPVLALPGLIIGTILAFITIFRSPSKAGSTAPFYAAFKGMALGGITMFAETTYPGIGIKAIGLTFGILTALLFCYKSGLIKPTENFKLMIFSATMGIGILYLVSFVMSFFGSSIGFIHSNGLFGIGFSLFVVGIAALNLVLYFDFIEEGAAQGLPKYMEWYGAFSLMVTLVWLYMEILRLLMKLRSR